MSKELMYILITKMHIRLNDLIETNNYDLLCEKVQSYSKRLDKVLSLYSKTINENIQNSFKIRKPNSSDFSYKYKIQS